LDSFFEFIAEQRREKVLGKGIFLGTIHSAKGMEFSHVFILDGDWSFPHGANRWEEERRILYVAMTRAKETLTLMKAAGKPNPFIKEIRGESIISRKSHDKVENYKIKNFYHYEILGLNDIFMDYAGGFPSNHLIHKHISNLETGSEVFLVNGTQCVEIHDRENCCVARLANNASKKWSKQLNNIHKVRVLAMIKRNNKDPDESFKDWIKTETWNLPILEVVRKN
jgi:ATP-dependent DNA helicase RecQ